MKLVTLTTDMGSRDFYVALLKASLLSVHSDVQIVDISHQIQPFNSAEAAYQLSCCFREFPEGTIHVIAVDSEPVVSFDTIEGSYPSVMLFEKQYFIASDNGFFGAFLGESTPDAFYRLDNVLSSPNFYEFPGKNILCKAANELMSGVSIDDIASPYPSFNRSFIPQAIIEENLIKGHIIHVDSYGNLITNILKSDFDRVGKGAQYTIYFRSEKYFIDRISKSYNEVTPGEKLALFNSSGRLEIAMNRAADRSGGGADSLLGLKVDDMIRVVFTPPGSHKSFDTLFT